MKKKLLFIAAWFCLLSCSQHGQSVKAFDELVFIDHQNLRYIEDSTKVEFQVREAMNNMEKAAQFGVGTYLFFAKETFDAMLDLDSPVPGIGSIGQQAFAPESVHRRTGAYLRAALREALDYAKTKNIRVFYHSNQFIFANEALEVIKPAVWGTTICPGRDITWLIYREKLREFLTMFPDIAGFQVTGDETQVSVLECRCDSCRQLSFVDRVNLLTRETAKVCEEYGKELQMRTWGRMGELLAESSPARMGDGLPENVFFSIKNTNGDFHINNPVDELFIRAADPKRVVVEFDAWREYEGHNYYPCYMGDIWAPRFMLLQELGIRRIAVRLNWNSNKNAIFANPWGNQVNIYTFLKLAENPQRPADDILRAFVREYYPQSSQDAAFALFKYSSDFQKAIYYAHGFYNANHSRVQDADARTLLEALQKDGLFTAPEHFSRRREQIEQACKQAQSLVDALGPDIPAGRLHTLRQGIMVERMVALASTDKMEAWFWKKQQEESEYNKVRERLREAQRNWQAFDAGSYAAMNGAEMLTDL
jgi:hypothetical protein